MRRVVFDSFEFHDIRRIVDTNTSSVTTIAGGAAAAATVGTKAVAIGLSEEVSEEDTLVVGAASAATAASCLTFCTT